MMVDHLVYWKAVYSVDRMDLSAVMMAEWMAVNLDIKKVGMMAEMMVA
jgi:hypothetical protein